MLLYVIRRLLYVVPIGIGVTFIVFSLVHIAPGDPVSALLPSDAPQEMVDQARKDFGLDRPFIMQYGAWLGRAVRGDLGTSVGSGRPVAKEVAGAVGNTVILAISAGFVACTLGFLFGMVAGLWRDRFADHLVSLVTIGG